MKNFEVIPNHNTLDCWTCDGKGKVDDKTCPTCKGTGKWIETSYHMIYTTKSGQKIGFQGDTIK